MGHADLSALKSAIERVLASRPTPRDRELVQAALSAGTLSVATGEGTVAVGGNVRDTIIVTGDGAVVLHIDAGGRNVSIGGNADGNTIVTGDDNKTG